MLVFPQTSLMSVTVRGLLVYGEDDVVFFEVVVAFQLRGITLNKTNNANDHHHHCDDNPSDRPRRQPTKYPVC